MCSIKSRTVIGRLAARRPDRRRDLEIGEAGDVFRHRVVDVDLARVDQVERGRRGDGLAHGVNAEDRVQPHRLIGLHVHPAISVEEADLAVMRNDHDAAGDLLVGDLLFHELVDFGQLRGVSPASAAGTTGISPAASGDGRMIPGKINRQLAQKVRERRGVRGCSFMIYLCFSPGSKIHAHRRAKIDAANPIAQGLRRDHG